MTAPKKPVAWASIDGVAHPHDTIQGAIDHVSAPTIQKGTRCGCDDQGCNEGHGTGVHRCTRDAGRMVTVGYIGTTQQHEDGPLDVEPEQVFMCEPCAAFAEGRVAR